ncbi:MAG TPA: DUF4097 family beta strand repeat-containing protein [Pyrinomonadaceae bacterium]|nr:DUF4097 family beta strand repeat-containing protein [Pyrinomonadaceae bacterium]
MAERCKNCGAELFEGQQFCRACGAPTRQFSAEELPTQMLPHQQQQQPTQSTPATPLSTSPLSGRDTADPVYTQGYARYQPPAAVPSASLPAAQQPGRGARGWLYALLALLVVGVCMSFAVARYFYLNVRNSRPDVVKIVRPNVAAPVMPPMPPVAPGDAEDMMVDEDGADVSDEQTVITKTYPLAKDGTFALHNISGDIQIEGWDKQQAEVKIIKRGGSEEDRANLRIMREQSAGRLVFNTMPERHEGVEDVQYEVKLPRNLRGVEIVSNNSGVTLSNLSANVSVVLQRGDIELSDVSGTINSRTTKGSTKIVLGDTAQGAPQVYNGIHGDIELRLKPGVNAELKAETIDGDIEIDDAFGIKVEKRMIGHQAVGRIGKGGQPIVVKTVSGDIKIKS